MSTALRKRAKRDRELDRLHRRLNSPRPDLPILRTSERPRPTPSSPLPPAEVGRRPGEGLQVPQPPAPDTHTNPSPDSSLPLCPSASPADRLSPPHDTPPSALPEWTRLLPLPNTLPATFRRWLIRHIETTFRPDPSDSTAQYLAARIALAMAHQHLAAAREPDKLCTTWLRYEAMADRQYRHALRDWTNHQKTKPKPSLSSPPLPPQKPQAEAPQATNPPAINTQTSTPSTQIPPSLHNPTFAHKNAESPSQAETLAEIHDILTFLTASRNSENR